MDRLILVRVMEVAAFAAGKSSDEVPHVKQRLCDLVQELESLEVPGQSPYIDVRKVIGGKMPSARMTSKGQVTVPVEVREALGLEAGDRLLFEVRPDGIVEIRPQKVDLFSLFGVIKPSVQGVSLADMERAIGEGARGKNDRD